MGLIDILNGMQKGPHGQRDPNANPSNGSEGMSPITMAILGLLVYKAVKSMAGSQQPSPTPRNTRARPAAKTINVNAPATSGALSDLMKGSLGGLLAGGAAGSIVSGGLNDLLKQFQQSGQGHAVEFWVAKGRNKLRIAPKDLARSLGADKINTLVDETGMSRDQLVNALSQYLPQVIDRLTPQGRLPTENEAMHILLPIPPLNLRERRRAPPKQFNPSEPLVKLFYNGLMAHYEILRASHQELDKAPSLEWATV